MKISFHLWYLQRGTIALNLVPCWVSAQKAWIANMGGSQDKACRRKRSCTPLWSIWFSWEVAEQLISRQVSTEARHEYWKLAKHVSYEWWFLGTKEMLSIASMKKLWATVHKEEYVESIPLNRFQKPTAKGVPNSWARRKTCSRAWSFLNTVCEELAIHPWRAISEVSSFLLME